MDLSLIYISIVLVSLCVIWMVFLEARLRRLFRGTKARDLESIIFAAKKDLTDLQNSREKIEEYLASVEPRVKESIKHTGLVRFNAYSDVGGNQSFALALLDENKNGVVVSSHYGRDANRTYAKSVKGGESEYKLSEEEKEAIQKAITG